MATDRATSRLLADDRYGKIRSYFMGCEGSHAMSAIASSSDGNILVIRFTDSRILDEARIRRVGDDMIALLNKTEEQGVLLDFSGVGFMSSAMLRLNRSSGSSARAWTRSY